MSFFQGFEKNVNIHIGLLTSWSPTHPFFHTQGLKTHRFFNSLETKRVFIVQKCKKDNVFINTFAKTFKKNNVFFKHFLKM